MPLEIIRGRMPIRPCESIGLNMLFFFSSVQMARTQKNKATSFHLGQLKAKLAKLKRELLTPSSGGGGGGAGFDVARTGVASVGFIGFPSVGKSTLMSKLTGQHSEAAAYEFTTLTSVPGQVTYNGTCCSRYSMWLHSPLHSPGRHSYGSLFN